MALRDILVSFGVTVDQTELLEASKNVNGLVIEFNRLQRIAGFALAAIGARSLTDSADEYINLQNRLRAVTNTADEFNIAQKGVVDIARETSTPVTDAAEAYQRYTMATEGLGKSQEEVLEFTKRLTQATMLGGATAAESRGALIQFAQGMGTNFKAAGQEIRSIQEQAPLLAKIIAKAAGGSAMQLKELAKQGKITSASVFKALIDAGDDLDAQMAKRQKTFGMFWRRMGVEGSQFTKQLLPGVDRLIKQLDQLVKWTQEWVESGSAMNSFIAAGVVAVGALTFAFGGLALQLAAAAAPFVALFLLLDDFSTFMSGGESAIGMLLSPEAAEKLRNTVSGITDALKGWADALATDNDTAATAFADLFASRLKTAMMTAIDAVWAYAQQKFLTGAREVTGTKVVGPQFKNDINALPDPTDADSPLLKKVVDKWAEWSGFKDDRNERWRAEGLDPMTGQPLSEPTTEPSLSPLPVYARPPSAGQYGPPLPPPQITNNIVVEGNATPQTARDVARQTGSATAAALGRDRSAIGASVGVQ